MKASENLLDKFSIDYIRNQVLKNAYGNDDTFIASLDPRTLLIWYLFFGIVPWFINNVIVLLALFAFVIITTKMAKTVPLLMFVFCLGILSQTGYLFIVSIFFGGNFETILALLVLSLKVAVVSLASITVFSGMDPDKLANGLLAFGCPDQFSFSISFGYRILPLIMEEFQNIMLSFRLRGIAPDSKGIFGKFRFLAYQIKIAILSFYPLMLNMAKRSRTTVEALEMKGYKYAMSNKAVREMKLSHLKFTMRDYYFASASILYVAIVFALTL
ncbi:MAG: energy-coupling factor transporter transmembrane component T [Turicibacter sp.]|nr:energy-coupling factor transporter transmembrane component T [Turicibacter sp.]